MKKAYKLVKVDLDGDYVSAVAPSAVSVTYRPGKVTKPEFGKLFVFPKLPTWNDLWYIGAAGHAQIRTGCRIFECEVPSISRMQKIAETDTGSIIDFWKLVRNHRKRNISFTKSCPPNTGFVTQLTLTKDVTKDIVALLNKKQ